MLKEKWEAVKKHVSDNRRVYITAGITIVVTATVTVVITKLLENDEEVTIIDANDSNNFINSIIQKLNIYTNGRGHPGKPVLHIETGDIYRSHRAASKSLGIDERTISRHTNGHQEHADGQHFKDVQVRTQFDKRWKDYNKMLDQAVEEANRTGKLPEPV